MKCKSKRISAFFLCLALLLCQLPLIASAGEMTTTILPANNDIYYLRNAGTNKYLDVYDGAAPVHRKDLVTREFTGNISQQFRLVSEGSGYHSLRPVGNEALRVDVSVNNSGKLWLYNNNNTDAQRFKVSDAGNYRVAVYTKLNTTKVVEVQNGWSIENQPVQIWQRDANNMGMHWYLERASAPGIQDGEEYFIKNVYTGRYLDVQGGSISEAGTNVGNYDYNGNANQRWKVRRNSDGTYNLITSYNSELTLATEGRNVSIWYTGYGGDSEPFTLQRDNSLAYGGAYYITNKDAYNHIGGATVNDKYVTATGVKDVTISNQANLAALWSFERVRKGDADIISCSYFLDDGDFWFMGDNANGTHTSTFNSCGYTAYAFNNSTNSSTALHYLKGDDIYVHSQHGDKGRLEYRIDGDNKTYLRANDIRSLNNNALSNLRCFISLGCWSGYDDLETNMVRAVYNKGASFSLGWNNVTRIPPIQQWYADFLSNIKQKKNIAVAIQDTDYNWLIWQISDGERFYLGDAEQFLYH